MGSVVPFVMGAGGFPERARTGDFVPVANGGTEASTAAQARFNLGFNAVQAERDLIYANGYTGLVDFLNAFADGVNNAAGIDAATSPGYLTTEAGVIKPPLVATGYTTVNNPTLSLNGTTGVSGYCYRSYFPAGVLTDVSGAGLRVTISPATTAVNTFISEMWLGNSVSAPSFTGDQVRVTFSGSNSVTLTGNGSSVVSDPVFYPYTGTSNLVVAFEVPSSPTSNTRYNGTAGTTLYYKLGTGETSTTSVSGYSNQSGVYCIDLIEAITSTSQGNLDVRSVSRAINDVPTLVDVYALVEETDALTLNSDLLLYGSRDGSTSYVLGTATKLGVLANGLSLIAATGISVTGQTSAKNLRWKVVSANGKQFKLHAIAAYGRP